jgi:hypothetical protein
VSPEHVGRSVLRKIRMNGILDCRLRNVHVLRNIRVLLLSVLISASMLGWLTVASAFSDETASEIPISIGSRRELFVDEFLIESRKNTQLILHHPQPQEIALHCDRPWEGNTCIYFRIIPDGGKYRMWYQGAHWKLDPDDTFPEHPYFICYAESTDGIHWERPSLGLHEYQGSKDNNICVTGVYDNFTPFLDTNPNCPPESRYKAVGQAKPRGLIAHHSPDGIHWSPLGSKPIIEQGAFDTQNVVFWDSSINQYRAYIRDFHDGLRDIRLALSPDFRTWTTPERIKLTPEFPGEQHYTNCIAPYYRAPHLYFGFPGRYVERNWSPSMNALPDLRHRELRAKKEQRIGTAISDEVFMSSRDGLNFHRWGAAFLRNGPEREGNWVYGDCYQAYGLIETPSKLPGAAKELSIFVPEDYWKQTVKMRRYTLRIDGFVSAHAPLEGGELLTKPFRFEGSRLSLNFATSAAGSLYVELTDAAGKPIPGFSKADADELFGDTLDRTVTWKNSSDVSALVGKTVRLRFELRDADVYSFQFADH